MRDIIVEELFGVLGNAMEKFDVVVVGAGPTGLMAAREASRRGVRVLLLEKENHFGCKPCGEAVSKNALQTAEIPSSDKSKVILNRVKGCYIYSQNEVKVLKFPAEDSEYREGYIINKPFFLRRLAELAAEEGVTIRMNSEAKSVIRKNGKIRGVAITRRGKRKQVLSKTVIGCDGFNSAILKDAFGISPSPMISCIQYKMANCRGLEKEMLKIYLGRDIAPDGYVWVFPTSGTTANVGIGVGGKPAKPYLDRYIRTHPDMFGKAQALSIGAAPVPICGQLSDSVEDNLLICGDAAGQVIPLTGAGIHSCLHGGKLAGRVMTEALSDKDTSVGTLKEYWKEYDNPWGKRIRDSAKALRAIKTLNDEELTELGELLSSRDVVDLANGFNIARVARILLSHPTFVPKVSKILLS